MQRRCDRNRKRSKRRSIYCPIHGNNLDSVSPKYNLYADRAGQLQQRGVSRKNALLLIATQTTVALTGEWLEAFWCQHCQQTQWYHVKKVGDRAYELCLAPQELWQQVNGVIYPHRNPTVSEFSQRHARQAQYGNIKDFRFVS